MTIRRSLLVTTALVVAFSAHAAQAAKPPVVYDDKAVDAYFQEALFSKSAANTMIRPNAKGNLVKAAPLNGTAKQFGARNVIATSQGAGGNKVTLKQDGEKPQKDGSGGYGVHNLISVKQAETSKTANNTVEVTQTRGSENRAYVSQGFDINGVKSATQSINNTAKILQVADATVGASFNRATIAQSGANNFARIAFTQKGAPANGNSAKITQKEGASAWIDQTNGSANNFTVNQEKSGARAGIKSLYSSSNTVNINQLAEHAVAGLYIHQGSENKVVVSQTLKGAQLMNDEAANRLAFAVDNNFVVNGNQNDIYIGQESQNITKSDIITVIKGSVVGSNNTVNLTQAANAKTLTNTIRGDNNNVTVRQKSALVNAEDLITYADGNTSSVFIGGNNNTATITQGGLHNRANEATITIGNENILDNQFNTATITQSGDHGTANISITGNNNEATIADIGQGNNLTINQAGKLNIASINASGTYNNVTLTQTGDKNNAPLTVNGNGNNITYTQTGYVVDTAAALTFTGDKQTVNITRNKAP